MATTDSSEPDTNQPALSEAVMQHIRNGHTIAAIKQLRGETGLGLKEAKHIVDKEVGQFRANNPNHAMGQQASWGPRLFFIVLALVALYWFLTK